jgi:hypothetical protein
MRQGNGVWANVTNFKDGDTTKIKGSMNNIHGKKSIADIINISERCYIFTVFWSIFYNELKPLKFARGKGRLSDNVQVVDGRTYFRAPPMRDYVHPGTIRLGDTRPHTIRITLHQILAEIIPGPRRFRSVVCPTSDDFKVDSTRETFIGQIARHKCAVHIGVTASSKNAPASSGATK